MRKTVLRRAREQLLAMRRDVLREMEGDLREGRAAVADDGMDTYDLASRETDRELSFLLTDREREKLRAIDEALERIDDGSYGICESCEAEIKPGRLEVQPFSLLCVGCKSDAERRERHLPGRSGGPPAGRRPGSVLLRDE